MKYRGKHVHTVTAKDVGGTTIPRKACICHGRRAGTYDLGFPLQSSDVGRWLVEHEGTIYIETAEQAQARKEKRS